MVAANLCLHSALSDPHYLLSTMVIASLLLAWQVKDKPCLVIGAGEVALSRVVHLARANAKITIVSGPYVHPKLEEMNKEGKIHLLIRRGYKPEDLTMYESSDKLDIASYKDITEEHFALIGKAVFEEHFACVCCCIDNPELSAVVYHQCKYLRLPVNIADKPPMCDFYFGSMYTDEAVQIMISTNGKSPRLLKMIKDDISRQFAGLDLSSAVDNLGDVRLRLREVKIPGTDLDSIDKRMDWIKALTDFFTLRQWSVLELSPEAVDKIIHTYPEFPPRDYEEFKDFIKSSDEK